MQPAPGRPAPYTKTHTRPLEHADGRAAYEIDGVVTALHGLSAQVQDGGPQQVSVDATVTDESLPEGRNAWPAQAPRGGLP